MKDPFKHEIYVKVKMFGKIRKCRALATDQVTIDQIESHIFQGADEVLWIERGEDLYASHHYSGKSTIRVTREDWLRGIGEV